MPTVIQVQGQGVRNKVVIIGGPSLEAGLGKGPVHPRAGRWAHQSQSSRTAAPPPALPERRESNKNNKKKPTTLATGVKGQDKIPQHGLSKKREARFMLCSIYIRSQQ